MSQINETGLEARELLEAELEREGWKPFPISRFWTSGSGRASLAAITAALNQRDEARSLALEEAARIAEEYDTAAEHDYITESVAAAIRSLFNKEAEG